MLSPVRYYPEFFDAPPVVQEQEGRARVADEKVVEVKIIEPVRGYDANNPQMTVVDPKRNCASSTIPRVGDDCSDNPRSQIEEQVLLQQVQQL